jgi:hypothetical protein
LLNMQTFAQVRANEEKSWKYFWILVEKLVKTAYIVVWDKNFTHSRPTDHPAFATGYMRLRLHSLFLKAGMDDQGLRILAHTIL